MAIEYVVEDGTGLSTATSYISTADFDQYWENVGYTNTLSTDEKQVSLLFVVEGVDLAQVFDPLAVSVFAVPVLAFLR